MGGWRSVREPEWDWIDRAIMAAWRRLHTKLCQRCGRPLAVHDTDSEDDYEVGFFTCTATARLDLEQVAQAKRDEIEIRNGHHPERWRMWATWTADEGPPSTS